MIKRYWNWFIKTADSVKNPERILVTYFIVALIPVSFVTLLFSSTIQLVGLESIPLLFDIASFLIICLFYYLNRIGKWKIAIWGTLLVILFGITTDPEMFVVGGSLGIAVASVIGLPVSVIFTGLTILMDSIVNQSVNSWHILVYLMVSGLFYLMGLLTRQYFNELQEYREKLEEKVRERTEELTREINERKKAETALQKTYDQLEKRVQERTKELQNTNDMLKEEIRDRKLMEQAFRQNKSRLKIIFETAKDCIFIKDSSLRYLQINPAMKRLFGVPASEFVGKTDAELFGAEKTTLSGRVDQKVLKGEVVEEEDVEFVNGKVRSFHVIKVPLHNESGKVVGIYGIARDISELKRTEKALKENEKKYKALYSMVRLMCDNVPDMIWAKDLNKNYIFTNQAICKNLLNARDTEEPLGKNDIFFAKRERDSKPDNPNYHTFGEICRDSDTIVMETKKPKRFDEYGNVRGEFLYLDVYKAPFWDENGKLIGTVGCGRDVTQEKELEAEKNKTAGKLQKSLKEKELLLKEVHHRVKNNLQVICSLLTLKAKSIKDEEARKLFEESRDRVRTIAILYEKLHQSNNFGQIDFRRYVKSLTNNLLMSYENRLQKISLKVDIHDVFLDIDRAIPCGLLINELITNSLKFAFPPNQGGEILVKMNNIKNKYELIVQDNGIGLPKNVKVGTAETVGMKLVNALAAQLEGNLEVTNTVGVRFRLTF